jgi:hypothetical protein
LRFCTAPDSSRRRIVRSALECTCQARARQARLSRSCSVPQMKQVHLGLAAGSKA